MNTAATTEGAPSRAELEARIIKRCWTDEAFRTELLADPVACFVKHTGLPAEQAPNIVVHEERGRDWHIVVPARPARAGELSDEDLERVAGGTDPLTTVVATVGSATVTIMVTSAVASAVVSFTMTIKETNKW